ncbi:hypothetical protein NL676_020435 [Syzygium grande]|nr:hypothetical protein NL676_020435 [Syzygium grande]
MRGQKVGSTHSRPALQKSSWKHPSNHSSTSLLRPLTVLKTLARILRFPLSTALKISKADLPWNGGHPTSSHTTQLQRSTRPPPCRTPSPSAPLAQRSTTSFTGLPSCN